MSDCSTQAMVPKERRTCGNCGHGVQTNVFCRESDGSTAGLHSLGERGCRKWVGHTDTLEQRYERLAQVARSMYRVIAMFETRFEAEHYSPSEWAPERGAITKSTKEQLEALGVSVDGVG